MTIGSSDVISAYRWIVGRDPTADELALGRQTSDDRVLRSSLVRSPEFADFLSSPDILPRFVSSHVSQLAVDQPAAALLSNRTTTPEDVRELFRVVLKRDTESTKITESHVRDFPNLYDLVEVLINSLEFKAATLKQSYVANMNKGGRRQATCRAARTPRPPKVLIFGAYGNGNLGDLAQAEALASLVRSFVADVEITATSWEQVRDFEFESGSIAPSDEILRPWGLENYDFLMIGGGGLLGVPHFPLDEAEWVWALQRVRVPYALVGVGAGRPVGKDSLFVQTYNSLIQGAEFVGFRDADVTEEMRDIRPDTAFFPDPVLLEMANRTSIMAKPRTLRTLRHMDVLFIVKGPVCIEEEAFNEYVIRFLTDHKNKDISIKVICVEPEFDHLQIDSRLLTEVETVGDWEGLLVSCQNAKTVVSARYHGCIAGIFAGAATFGVVQPKIRDLFDIILSPECFLGVDFDGFRHANLSHVRSRYLAGIAKVRNDGAVALACLKGKVSACLESRKTGAHW